MCWRVEGEASSSSSSSSSVKQGRESVPVSVANQTSIEAFAAVTRPGITSAALDARRSGRNKFCASGGKLQFLSFKRSNKFTD